ncbi:HD domain-containing protein [Paractinoplanes brasiliensis]|uniref:Histidine kinase/DNA gyrase B/HSP90-like ATPase n=1 Tax=Paractinoplanes brasiliensis TaxID=52695 RepID=A0A4V3C7I5_9ACTN|nr:ATP-binding protein [Actinoplanes brasiliensis]TDO37638.1 histidine kinase/DNA gyrase B/HSP90-like ATPase [Actinoplanes brasiliensis]GID31792.1 molecular chaperone [Actinoplanes brasiliensis]
MGDWGPLGEVLHREGSDRNRANVKDLVAHAKDLLKLVRETFPTYTMHDEQHAENVIALMGKLAAPRIERMTPLEAALLILAAYFHDAGMAYSRADLAEIVEGDDFHAFLDGHDDDLLLTARHGGVPPDPVVQHYCRARHAERVRWHLDRCDWSLLQWDGAPIIEPLVTICRSHNEDTEALHDPRFETDFHFQADLRFCAVLLRLADILDLDDTRAPRVIYEHLDLVRDESAEARTSDREWSKHLVSKGFRFPPEHSPHYRIKFIATPDDPRVERDLRAFLDVVRAELSRCRSLADKFDNRRWAGFPLPAEIDDSAILSRGYVYGDFRFELDRGAILELFTGSNLYDDPYAFVRELLQNALDAIRARESLTGYRSAGIQVYCREDADGYLWVRVDDDGIGMDRDRLQNYFLRAGKSYYRSEEFAVEQLRRTGLDRPLDVIAQFGIGVLACFMAGDRVELTSRRHVAPGRTTKGVRLSISQRDEYFVLQESDRPGTPMPGPPGAEAAFLREAGTRIAVRIDPNRTGIEADEMLERIKSYIFAPPVPVFVNGQQIGAETSRLVDEPTLPAFEVAEIDLEGLVWDQPSLPCLNTIRAIIVPIDLSTAEISPDIRGKALAYLAFPPAVDEPEDPLPGLAATDPELSAALRGAVTRTRIALHFENYSRRPEHAVRLRVDRMFRKDSLRSAYQILSGRRLTGPTAAVTDSTNSAEFRKHLENTPQDLMQFVRLILEEAPAGHLFDEIEVRSYLELTPDRLPAPDAARRLFHGGSTWSYNGIKLPVRDGGGVASVLDCNHGFLLGAISLSGAMRPELSVSRSEVRSISFAASSILHLSVRRAMQKSLGDSEWATAALDALGARDLTIFEIPDPCTEATVAAELSRRGDAWRSERVIETAEGWMSIDDLLASAETGASPSILTGAAFGWTDFQTYLTRGLLQRFTSLEWTPPADPESRGELRLISAGPPSGPERTTVFRPLFAVPYTGDESLARSGPFLNQRHALTQWLLGNASVLAAEFPAPFQKILRETGSFLADVEPINAALRRVADRRPDIAPPAEAYLRVDEQGQWWSQ